jgi:hypothetical protein
MAKKESIGERNLESEMMAMSAYSHMMHTGNFEEQDELRPRKINDRTAELPDGTRLRLTPEGQKTVQQLLYAGDEIKTSYDSGGRVLEVKKFETYGLPNYTIVLVDFDKQPSKAGFYRETDLRWINGCVAQDGQIRMLFEANEDTVKITKECVQARCQQMQQTLLGTSLQKPYLKVPDGTRHARILVRVETDKAGVFKPPYWSLDYRCGGCGSGCGGGHCCQNPEDVDRDLEKYKQHILHCRDPMRGIRHIIIDLKDERRKSKKQAKLPRRKTHGTGE